MTPTLPYRWYSDPETLRLEQRRLFARSWQYVGHAGELPRPGSYKATRIGDVPVLLVRDEQDTLRAFVNVCRHRGALVCDGTGERGSLQCPYHAWTYALDGRLVQAPRLAAEGAVDTAELGLVPLRLETWGPLLFVNADPDARELGEEFAEVRAGLADAGIDVASLRFVKRWESEIEANWKIIAENFLECYHCPVAHPGFSRAMDVAPDAYELDARGLRMSQVSTPRADATASTFSGEVARGQFHLLFPSTVVNVYPGRANLSIGPLAPRSATRTYRMLDYFIAADASDEWFKELLEVDDRVGEEDRMLVERVQLGVASGALQAGRLMPVSERLVAHFQALVADALAGAPGA